MTKEQRQAEVAAWKTVERAIEGLVSLVEKSSSEAKIKEAQEELRKSAVAYRELLSK